ncbi:hypothetical protein NAS141_10961 [Sulfitobacter sp. NAS-14.1]|nr:hypothetical protein NAS141_10961 [Sulfitobacter sp. NAS-14.1]
MQRIGPIGERTEEIGDIGMVHRFARVIGHEVLLGHIGHVIALFVFGQQVIIGLVFLGAAVFRNSLIPFFGIGKFGVHVKNHPSEGMFFVPDDLAQVVFRARSYHNIGAPTVRS